MGWLMWVDGMGVCVVAKQDGSVGEWVRGSH